MAEHAQKRLWLIAALALALTYAAVLFATASDMGYTRDEGYYFKAAEQYGAWWDTLFSKDVVRAFGDDEIKTRFGYNTEHPALVKLAQGITHRVLHRWLGVTGSGTGFRAAGILFAALAVLATFLLGRDLASPKVGLVAALLLTSIPRWFYDAHLACFDVPIAAMWTLSLWSFWRALEAPDDRVKKRSLFAGLVFGLALATKLNALFLPAIFVALWLLHSGLAGFANVRSPSGGTDIVVPRVPRVLIACAVIGPLVFVATWPYLWHDTVVRIGTYIGFHLNHEHYPIRYFGEIYVKPPFPRTFPWVMSALTLPSPLFALGALGGLVALGRALVKKSSADLVLVLSVLLPLGLISTGTTPIFGGVKHWYNAMPALCVLAARVLFDGVELLRPKLGAIAAPALVLLVTLPGFLGIRASHPNGIGYYNELAGGIRGGAELGMQRSFWGGLSKPLLKELAAQPPGTRAFMDHTNYDAFNMYQREGLLPRHVTFANKPEEATAATVFIDREGHPLSEEAVWTRLGTRPTSGVYVDEVPFVQLYLSRR